jgi:hypothetical protein
MVTEIKAPNLMSVDEVFDFTIFLAGSIEMGKAVDWQTKLAQQLSPFSDVTLFNPRREVWDPSWVQSINNPKFLEQVEWELDHIESSDLVVFYFDPATKSPISLLELGIVCASRKDAIVCCPPSFYRKGNVDITCAKYHVDVVETLEELVVEIKHRLRMRE